jgi:MoaA/NifB/PqqE/SkfB family radical SAM enzyme
MGSIASSYGYLLKLKEMYGMNNYIDLKRIEFLVTMNCSSRCKHCSVGDKLCTGSHNVVDAHRAAEAITSLSDMYDIDSLMTFGGEPLLYHDVTTRIHQTAKDCGIPNRQLITNGYFSKDRLRIDEVAKGLSDSGVNSLLLSVDYFHQETIPVDNVIYFAQAVLRAGIENVKLHPAWVVSADNDNPYNLRTHELINRFSHLEISCSDGNIISPLGNAAVFLKDYFDRDKITLPKTCSDMPYSDPLDNISSISISPEGSVSACRGFSMGNIYQEDIESIIKRYNPYENEHMAIILRDGIEGLLEYARGYGVSINKDDYFSLCDMCIDVRKQLK